MSRLRVERLQRVEHAPGGAGWQATCRYCCPPLDGVPHQAPTWGAAGDLLSEHVERQHPELVRGRAAA